MYPGNRITYNDLEISSEISIIGNMDTIIASVAKLKESFFEHDEKAENPQPPLVEPDRH